MNVSTKPPGWVFTRSLLVPDIAYAVPRFLVPDYAHLRPLFLPVTIRNPVTGHRNPRLSTPLWISQCGRQGGENPHDGEGGKEALAPTPEAYHASGAAGILCSSASSARGFASNIRCEISSATPSSVTSWLTRKAHCIAHAEICLGTVSSRNLAS